MGRKFKALTFLIVALLLLFPANPAPAFDGSEITNVVSIGNRCSGAYFHTPGNRHRTFVLTAAHCVPDKNAPILIVDGGEIIFGTVLLVDYLSDYAVVQVRLNKTQSQPLLVARHFPVITEPIHYSGNTLDFSHLVFEGRMAGHPAFDTWVANGMIWFGLSGSPLYNAQGEVIGVVSAMPINEGIPIFSIILFHTLPENLNKQIRQHMEG